MTAAGVAGAYFVVVKIVESASEDTFPWTLPALAILAAFLVEICKEFHPEDPLTKILFATIAAVMTLVGGVLYRRRGLRWKLLGAGFQIVPPGVVLLSIVASSGKSNLGEALADVSLGSWIVVVVLLVVAIATAILSTRQTARQPAA